MHLCHHTPPEPDSYTAASPVLYCTAEPGADSTPPCAAPHPNNKRTLTHGHTRSHAQMCPSLCPRAASPVLCCTAESGADPTALCAAVAARLARLLAPPPGGGAPAAAAAADAVAGAPKDAALSAGLSRALCYIHRRQAAARGGGAGGAGANTAAAIGAAAARQLPKPRVLVIAAAADAPVQYIPTMNAIFSAQHAGVAIDALVGVGCACVRGVVAHAVRRCVRVCALACLRVCGGC